MSWRKDMVDALTARRTEIARLRKGLLEAVPGASPAETAIMESLDFMLRFMDGMAQAEINRVQQVDVNL